MSARGALWIFLREIVIVVVLALALSFVAKTWLVQSFWIPSDSMNNTLVRADRVVVSKLTPGPFDLKRGDIVVFTDPGHWLRNAPSTSTSSSNAVSRALSWVGLLPSDEGNHLIKRVIGLPGDTVSCCSTDGRLRINGVPITESYLFPGDVPSEIEFAITVPAGKIWVMGDHRSDSSDSRYNDVLGTETDDPRDNTGVYGSVPMENVVGSAFSIVWPLNRATWLGNPSESYASVPAAGSAPVKPAVSSKPSASADATSSG